MFTLSNLLKPFKDSAGKDKDKGDIAGDQSKDVGAKKILQELRKDKDKDNIAGAKKR